MIHKAKKSLGQNFLKSESALNKICEAGNVTLDDIILEIGPGKGALTKKLLEKAKKVIAVEKDSELIKIIEEKFFDEIKKKKLILINEDILIFDIYKIIDKKTQYKIIANIPYNITGAIFKKFLTEKNSPTKMAILVQKEVAERIVARDHKESILSLSVKAYGNPKYIMKVSKKFFSPKPKIDSAIILVDNISKNNFKNIEEENFFSLIKSGFLHKRKLLIRNLQEIENSKEELRKIFTELNINQNTRAEDLNLESWLSLAQKIYK